MHLRSILLRAARFIALTVLLSATIYGCALCHTKTGRQLRAGIFNPAFGLNLLVTLAPFPLLLGVVALLYFSPPRGRP